MRHPTLDAPRQRRKCPKTPVSSRSISQSEHLERLNLHKQPSMTLPAYDAMLEAGAARERVHSSPHT